MERIYARYQNLWLHFAGPWKLLLAFYRTTKIFCHKSLLVLGIKLAATLELTKSKSRNKNIYIYATILLTYYICMNVYICIYVERITYIYIYIYIYMYICVYVVYKYYSFYYIYKKYVYIICLYT